MGNLGYEQLKALQLMRDIPDLEASAIAAKVDCSWDELFSLSSKGLISLGIDRIKQYQVHPTITDEGLGAVTKSESENII